MTETSDRKKFKVTIGGDTVECLFPRDGQIVALTRASLVLQDEELPINSRLESLVLAEDIVLSLLAPGDLAWKKQLSKKLALGELELADVVSHIMDVAFTTDDEPEQPTAVKRRGRPRKVQPQ